MLRVDVRVCHVMVRSSDPSNCAGLSDSRYAIVARVAAIHSARVLSFASNTGTGAPASRAAPPCAMSLAIWICVARGNMSGKSRVLSKTAGSILRACACAAAFSRMAARLFNARVQVGTVAVYRERDMSSGRLVGGEELPQHVLQYAPVLVVVEFLRGVDAQTRLELDAGAVVGLGNHFDELRRAAVQSDDFKAFLAGQPQALGVLPGFVLQRQHAHANEIGAVNALEALGDHRLDAEQHGALGR